MRPIRPRTERAKPGEAIQEKWRTPHELAKLRALIATSKKSGDLHTWRRARAVWGYLKGKSVLKLVEELDVVRASVNNWIRWYDATGTESLKPRKAPGAAPKLSEEQRAKLTALIEAGPQAAGYMGGVWTGPRIREPPMPWLDPAGWCA